MLKYTYMRFHRAKMTLFSLIYGTINLGLAKVALAFDVPNPIQATTFAQVVQKIATLVATIGATIIPIFIIWSGVLFVTARGNDQQLTKAKGIFFYTMIGAAIIIGAYAIASAVVNFAQKL